MSKTGAPLARPSFLAIFAGAATAATSRRAAKMVKPTVLKVWFNALDMPGFSLSLLFVDDDMIALIDAATTAVSWPGIGSTNRNRVLPAAVKVSGTRRGTAPGAQGIRVREGALAAAAALIAAEDRLTELDSIAGDGDLGSSMRRGAEAIRSLDPNDFTDAATGLAAVGNALRRAIAGSSGPFLRNSLVAGVAPC